MKNRHQIQPNELSKEAKVSLRTRIISAIIAIAIALPCALFGDVLFAVFIAFIEIVAIFEILRSTQQRYSPFLYAFRPSSFVPRPSPKSKPSEAGSIWKGGAAA